MLQKLASLVYSLTELNSYMDECSIRVYTTALQEHNILTALLEYINLLNKWLVFPCTYFPER